MHFGPNDSQESWSHSRVPLGVGGRETESWAVSCIVGLRPETAQEAAEHKPLSLNPSTPRALGLPTGQVQGWQACRGTDIDCWLAWALWSDLQMALGRGLGCSVCG